MKKHKNNENQISIALRKMAYTNHWLIQNIARNKRISKTNEQTKNTEYQTFLFKCSYTLLNSSLSNFSAPQVYPSEE